MASPSSGLEAVSETQHEVGLSIGLLPFKSFAMWSFLRQWLWRFRHLVLTSFHIKETSGISRR